MPPSPATLVLARGLRQYLDVWRHGDADERALARVGRVLLRDFIFRVGIVDAGRVLDYVVAPGFRKVEVRAPVFVVAPPRSGTTLLYGLLAADPRFFGPRLYETLLPSLSLLRLTEGIAALVKRLRGPAAVEGFARWEEYRFAEADPIHRVRHGELEEDTLLFDRHLMCPSSLRFFPRGEELAPLTALDDQAPAARMAVMEAYYRALQRLLYRTRTPGAPARTYLAKNVHSAGRIGSLLERFPDARFIHIVRSPYAVIPSAVRLFRVSNYLGVLAPRRPTMPLEHPCWRVYAELVIDAYARLLRWEREVPRAQWITLRFESLIADPMATVRRIYDHFAIEPTPTATTAIAERAASASQYRSSEGSAPRLEDCGLTRAQVHERLRAVFEAYDLEP
jgi:omega-hydroxy-beta-dihydromenaquinone-9 sulfotransferase